MSKKIKRKMYDTILPHEYGKPAKMKEVKKIEDAVLISSETTETETTVFGKNDPLHAPVIDLDLPCRLEPSATPGHFHLYIDKAVPWYAYERLLKALADCGIIEKGYYRASQAKRASFVRSPKATLAKRNGEDKAGEVVASLKGLEPVGDGSGEWREKTEMWRELP